ncbi:MAG: hypothetical protein KDE35_04665 [Geminicoccaceae bacterium]|nr:hypothetical protein [Geminicoccaceae bacterium]
MIELVFLVCLAAAPNACEEQVLPPEPDVGIVGCLMSAQPRLARWAETHPAHRIVRWRCSHIADRQVPI